MQQSQEEKTYISPIVSVGTPVVATCQLVSMARPWSKAWHEDKLNFRGTSSDEMMHYVEIFDSERSIPRTTVGYRHTATLHLHL